MTVNNDTLEGITVFTKIVSAGSFRAAADDLGHSVSFLSKELTKLENRLGTRLLNRTTRSLSLTEVGRLYLSRCQQLLDTAEDAERVINQLHGHPKGLLKFSAPISFGPGFLNIALPKFLKAYPDLDIDVDYNDRKVDVVNDGYDVVVRGGKLEDSSLVSRLLMRSTGHIVASPGYLKQFGTPSHPRELAGHNCITYSQQSPPKLWNFVGQDGKPIQIKVRSRVHGNNAELECTLAERGIGITALPEFVCAEQLKDGRLVSLLSDFKSTEINIYAVYPHQRFLSAKVRAFIDFMVAEFKPA